MTLDKLKQIKDSIDKGVIVSKPSWLEVLDWAIELTKNHESYKPLSGLTTGMKIIADGEQIYRKKMEGIRAGND